MADFNFSDVASKIQPPKEGMSLADMVNMARGVQAYQQAGQLNPLQAQKAQLELEQLQKTMPLSLREQQAKTSLAEGVLSPSISKATSEAETAQTGTKSAQLKLSGEKLKRVLEISGARATDPEVIKLSELAKSQDPEIASKAKKRLHQLNYEDFQTAVKGGLDGAEAMESFGHITQKIDSNPEQLPALYQNAVRIGSGAAGQLGLQTPKTGVNAAGQTTAVNPVTGQYEVMGTPQTNPMSSRTQTFTDPITGNIIQAPLTPQGTLGAPSNLAGSSSGPLPPGMLQGLSGNVGMGNPNAPQAIPAFENKDTLAAARAIQLDSNQRASKVAETQFNNNQIIKLADEAITGRGAANLGNLTGGYAVLNGLGIGGGNATNLQQLGHFMSLETANLAQSAGLGTDSARGLANEVVGKTDWTPEAIKNTAKTNRALSTGIDLFNRGVNNAVQAQGNNPLAAKDFRNKWSQVADVEALKLMDAVKNKDQEEIKKIVKDLGGVDSEKYKKLLAKTGFINNLIKGQ